MGASMGPEANIDLIRALEKQIVEGNGDIIKLKRDRNSLLNISAHVPPEILGHIFARTLVREGPFQGLRRGSYSFLLVCHHWFEVASNTPELWSFWGNTFGDWKKRHGRSAAAPLDLVLHEYHCYPDTFNESLKDAVRSRVMQGTIRQVHLISNNPYTLIPVISSLTPNDGGGQNENIESIALHSGEGPITLLASNFFARSCLSRLRSLDLYGNVWIPPWDRFIPQTTLLTSLSLNITTPTPSPRPTAAQLFSILTSNPNLQELVLSDAVLPDDTDASTSRVQLRHLKTLSLTGEPRRLFGLVQQLILPEMLDVLHLTGSDSTVEDISQTLAPYMQDYFQRDPRFRDTLGVSSSISEDSISISVTVAGAQTIASTQKPPRVSLTVLTDVPPPDIPEQLLINLITLIPRERVVFFRAGVDVKLPDEFFLMMPNIETLHLPDQALSKGFLQPNPDGPHVNMKLLPSLRSLRVEYVGSPNDNDLGPLKTHLAHQTSDNQAVSLEVIGHVPSWFPHPEICGNVLPLMTWTPAHIASQPG